ncbi:hypothetical protein SNE40_019506 [Patella caerulea]|uniref:Carboxylic ester hydrolase n=1 Tax=Patella caerulea TaxID=87958 RepID=A0AAN8PAG7_PATCE
MIFIHGGGFVVGKSSSYNGDILAAYGEVVVVTINYRVGPFGFLSTGDDQAPGNYGLWDQHLAIQWVKNNIASFGGDTSRITIFGESSGSASVMYQILFAGNKGLFQRAIAISGSATANWASVPKDSGLEYAKNLAIKFNCSVTKGKASEEILKCLRSIDDATEIATAEVNSVWAPTPDNDFIREDVIASIKWPPVSTPNYQEFDLILGTNGYEGHFFLHTAFQSILSNVTKAPITELRELFKNLVKATLPEIFSKSWEVFPKSLDSTDQAVDAIMFAYSASENPNNRDYNLKQICDFLTDVQMFIPTAVDARNHAYMNNRTKTYQYEFNQQYPFLLPEDTWLQGATHGGALPFIFGFPSSLFGYTPERAEAGWPFAKLVMDYWTNFAKTGDPNNPRSVPTTWKEYNFNEQDYLYFPNTGNPENKSYPNAQRVNFWLDYITTIIKHGEAAVPDSTCTPTASMSITHHNVVLLVISLCLLCCW